MGNLGVNFRDGGLHMKKSVFLFGVLWYCVHSSMSWCAFLINFYGMYAYILLADFKVNTILW